MFNTTMESPITIEVVHMVHTLNRLLSKPHQFVTTRHKRLLPGIVLILLVVLPLYASAA